MSLELTGQHDGHALLFRDIRAPNLIHFEATLSSMSLSSLLSAVIAGAAPRLASMDLELNLSTETMLSPVLASLEGLESACAAPGIWLSYELPWLQAQVLADASFPLTRNRRALIRFDCFFTGDIASPFHAMNIRPNALLQVIDLQVRNQRTAYSPSTAFTTTYLLVHLQLPNLVSLKLDMAFVTSDLSNVKDIILARRIPYLQTLSGELRWKMEGEAATAWNTLLDACTANRIDTATLSRIHVRGSADGSKYGKVTRAELQGITAD